MKKLLMTITAAVLSIAAFAQAPAFPGAEGHGRYVTGGRGGKIVHVTNLNDSGTGSLRAAVNGSDKKIVVFDVGGVIALKSDLKIGANTTIAGQTAPAPGITVRYYTIRPDASNIIVRFIRFRRGQEKDVNDGADAIWTRHQTGQIYDHCSFSWSIDEIASFYDNNNFTMQWCTLAESLNNAGHGKGAHGYGGIWGGKLASFHHNLIAHVNNRSPRFNGARYDWTGYTSNKLYSQYKWANAVQSENVDFRNCIIYNCGNGCYGGPGGGRINIVNNYYKTGPAASTDRVTNISIGNSTSSSDNSKYWNMTSLYYIKGNQVNSNANRDWTGINYDSGVFTINGEKYTLDTNHYYGDDVTYTKNSAGQDCVRIRLENPTEAGEVTTHSALKAYEKVLSFAGASLNRDDVDTRYAKETREGTATYSGSVTKKKGRIDLVSDVQGYTEANFGTGSRPAGYDTDNDGIPDEWEKANGLNPNNASDALLFTLDKKNWYSNIEVYLNSLVQDIMLQGNADADESVDEYYPAYVNPATGEKVDEINGGNPEGGTITTEDVSFTISQLTNTGNNTSSVWDFNDGITISNEKSKSYAAGKENGIKYSAGVQYTIHLPEKVSISKMLFTGYDNYGETDAYIGEINGTTYDKDTYVFPQKDASEQYFIKSHEVTLPYPAKETLTFTPQGKQVVWIIDLTGTKETSGIDVTEASQPVSTTYYNLQGMRVEGQQHGIIISKTRLANGKTITKKVIR
jgi:hypothetical protein